jgi:hypothetical protein
MYNKSVKIHQRLQNEVRRIHTYFPDSQNNVTLQYQGDRIGIGSKVWFGGCTSEARDLQNRRNLIRPKLSVELQNGGICWRLCSKDLVMDGCYTLRRESVRPCTD